MTTQGSLTLPRSLHGRSIHYKVIPTVCSLKNMIQKLKLVNGDVQQLKPWEKRSFQAYHIDRIKHDVLTKTEEEVITLIREQILLIHPNDLGASCIDIYLVAYVAENIGSGKDIFFDYIYKNGISDKENSANAIWQVGKGDGVYLGLLHEDGSIKDWEFFEQWISDKDEEKLEIQENTNKPLIDAFNKDECKGLAIDTYVSVYSNLKVGHSSH